MCGTWLAVFGVCGVWGKDFKMGFWRNIGDFRLREC